MVLNSRKSLKNSDFDIKIFIDFDPNFKVFYYNYFFEEYKIVLKIALTPPLNDNDDFWDNATNSGDCLDLKYEKFDLTKYKYLLHFQ